MRLFHAGNITQASGSYDELYIFAGQSNTGRSTTGTFSPPQGMSAGEISTWMTGKTYPNVQLYNPHWGFTDFANMQPGQNTRISPATVEFGSEMSFMASFPLDKVRYVLKFGVGNTNLNSDWNPPSGVHWLNLLTYAENAITKMQAFGKNPRLMAFIWIQGENDATNLTWANAYQANLQEFFDTFDTEWASLVSTYGLNDSIDYKRLIAKNNGQYSASQFYNTTVQAAQEAFVAIPANRAEIIDTTDFLTYDNTHYGATENITLGQRLYTAYTT